MQTIELNISGMMCGACVEHVTKGLESVAGVQNVAVDLVSARATVSGEYLDVSQLVGAVEEEGYEASEFKAAG
jgi:copper chaperone CopZ